MSDNRPLSTDIITATYNSLVAAINYEYCKKYGYDDFTGLSKYVLKGAVTLTESQIKEVKQIIIE